MGSRMLGSFSGPLSPHHYQKYHSSSSSSSSWEGSVGTWTGFFSQVNKTLRRKGQLALSEELGLGHLVPEMEKGEGWGEGRDRQTDRQTHSETKSWLSRLGCRQDCPHAHVGKGRGHCLEMEAAASSLRFSARRTAQSVFCVVGRDGLLSITGGAGPAGAQQVAWAGRSSRQDLGKGTRHLPPWPSWALVRSKELCASPGPFLDHLTHLGGWPSSQGTRWVLLQPNLGAVHVAGTRERQVRCPGTRFKEEHSTCPESANPWLPQAGHGSGELK